MPRSLHTIAEYGESQSAECSIGPRGPAANHSRSLDDVGRILCSLGLSSHPLAPWEVLKIERTALAKVKKGIATCDLKT